MIMSRRRKPENVQQVMRSFRDFRFDCEVVTAINPGTKSEVILVPPVKIRSFEDFARFYDEWEEFCKLLSGDPVEVCFNL